VSTLPPLRRPAAPRPPPATFPLRVAAIDTGSNAIRFLAAEFSDPQRYEVLASQRVPIRLGHQVFLNGRLAPETMDAAVRAFASFRDQMDALGIRHLRAVATSAVREARNGPLLVQRIERDTGIQLETITGSEEARLVHVGVGSRINLAGRQWILADLGGGSVEVSLVDDSGMLWSESHTMGSVRLLEELSASDQKPGHFQRLLEEYVRILRIPAPVRYHEPAGFIATGGNIEALAKVAAAQPDEHGVSEIPLSDLRSAIELLTRLSFRERMEQLDLREDRADVILPAGMVYLRLAELCGVRSILVPHVGVKEGLLLDLVQDLASHDSHEARQEAQITQAAVALGRRYLFDEGHALQVAELSLSLFDQLRDLHGLDGHDRILLKAAAILHDIGTFVALKRHHKHSLYLISRSELPGLSPEDMLVCANIARYHRKSNPAPHHHDYTRLPQSARVRVDQMAALLRLADALDQQRKQEVGEVRATVRGLELLLTLRGEGDLLLERWAVTRRKGLFEETYGLRVIVTGEDGTD
jgi:exopolyphosphatase / guanosine-5'-triphosphate,3'-diphosphate pyrophosphatase